MPTLRSRTTSAAAGAPNGARRPARAPPAPRSAPRTRAGARLAALAARPETHPPAAAPPPRGTKRSADDAFKKRRGGYTSPTAAAIAAAEVAAVRTRADGGCTKSMLRMAGFCIRGTPAVSKVPATAFRWITRAATLNNPTAAASRGSCYIFGLGVAKHPQRGLIEMARAAALGSEHACFLIGAANSQGAWGLDTNKEEARVWFGRMQDCATRDASTKHREMTHEWLRLHPIDVDP
jgi:TPR repeat protein